MTLTKEEKEKYQSYNRAYNLYSPNHNNFNAKLAKERQKAEEDKKKRAEKLLSRLKDMKKSAVKRGMYGQKPYQAKVTEEQSNA